jgi:hypothetical protein
MDSWTVESDIMIVCLGLYLVVCVLCAALLLWKRYILFLLWPILLYFCGPLITSVFSDAPVLGNYVFPDTIVAETLMMFGYCVFFVLIDFLLDTSKVIDSSFNGAAIGGLARSPIFLPVYLSVSSGAAILQVVVMVQYGSVFSGNYITSSNELIPFWGFLAGLYELIFLCFVLFLLDGRKSKFRVLIIAIYVMTAVLRVAGGTRLILIKELAVICILLYMRGRMKRSRLVLVAAIIVIMGSVIGFFRANGAIDEKGLGFGPLYGAAMESGLDALTLNVAYQVQESGYVANHGNLLETVEFAALSAIPSFLRVGIAQSDLDQMSPYRQALAGFDTSMPVGGMSGFATICYLSSYPLVCTLLLVLVLSLILRVSRQGPIRDVIVVVMSISVIHFWRDPIDIAVKNVTQDVVCALAFLYVPAVCRAVTSGWSRSASPSVAAK